MTCRKAPVVVLALGMMMMSGAKGEDMKGRADWARRMGEASRFYQAGNYETALERMEGLERESRVFDKRDEYRAVVLGNLGVIYNDLGRPLEAARCLEGAARLRAQLGGTDQKSMIDVLNALAMAYIQLQQYAKAEGVLESARERLAVMAGGTEAELARVELAQSRILQMRGQQKEAEEVVRAVLIKMSRRGGRAIPEEAFLWKQLGNILMGAERWGEAEDAYRRGYEQSVSLWGRQDLSTAKTAVQLAGAVRRNGRPQEAEKLAREAGEHIESTVGPGHPMVGAALLERAAALRILKRSREAKGLEQRADGLLGRYERANQIGVSVDARVLAYKEK